MQFRSSTPDLHNFYNSFLQKNRALNALSLLYCTPYTVHPTPRIKNIFYVFFFISRRAYICVYLPYSRPRAYLIYIHAKPTRRQASKQPQALNALAPIHPIHGGSQYQRPHRITPHQNFRIFVKNLTFL